MRALKTLEAMGAVIALSSAGAFAACGGGAHLERGPQHGASAAPSSSPSFVAAPPPSASVPHHVEPNKAARWMWAAVGCWVGGAWSEALGASGEEKHLATTRRCRIVSNETLATKDDDAGAVEAMRAIGEEPTAQAIEAIAAVADDHAGTAALLTATAAAAREALAARKAAKAGGGAEVGANAALAKLQAITGKLSGAAHTIALVLAADRIEATRALPGSGKATAGNAVLSVVFGSAKNDDWIALLTAVATKSGHPPNGKTERDALTGVLAAFADRFASLAKQLESAPTSETLGGGDARAVAEGYAALLRSQVKTMPDIKK